MSNSEMSYYGKDSSTVQPRNDDRMPLESIISHNIDSSDDYGYIESTDDDFPKYDL